MKSSKGQKKFKIFLLYYQQNIESSVNPDFVVLQINNIKYIYIYIYIYICKVRKYFGYSDISISTYHASFECHLTSASYGESDSLG